MHDAKPHKPHYVKHVIRGSYNRPIEAQTRHRRVRLRTASASSAGTSSKTRYEYGGSSFSVAEYPKSACGAPFVLKNPFSRVSRNGMYRLRRDMTWNSPAEPASRHATREQTAFGASGFCALLCPFCAPEFLSPPRHLTRIASNTLVRQAFLLYALGRAGKQ